MSKHPSTFVWPVQSFCQVPVAILRNVVLGWRAPTVLWGVLVCNSVSMDDFVSKRQTHECQNPRFPNKALHYNKTITSPVSGFNVVAGWLVYVSRYYSLILEAFEEKTIFQHSSLVFPHHALKFYWCGMLMCLVSTTVSDTLYLWDRHMN